MAMSINNIQMYSQLFTNPLSASESSGYMNKVFGAGVNALYGKKVDALAKNELSSYLKSFATNASSVTSAAAKVNGANKDNVFNERSSAVSEKAVAAATASAGAEMKTYNVKVENTAKAQQNKSNTMDAAAVNNLGAGKKTFTVEYGGKKTDISIDVKANYTNRDVMRLASEELNKSNAGVKSKVVEEGNGKISLDISGNSTGKDNTFKISDKEGNLISGNGLEKTATEAQDAKYSVDGKELTSNKNEIQLDNKKVNITLKDTGETKVTVGQDAKKITKAAEDLAASYNATMDFLKNNNVSPNTARLTQEMGNAVKFKRNALEGIGMTIDKEGRLSVDAKKLEAAMKSNPDRVKNVLSGSEGIGSRLEKISAQATAKPIVNFSDLVNNNSAANQLKLKPMDRMMVQKYSQQGLLFDSTT